MRILLVAPGEEAPQPTQHSWLLHSNEFLRRRAFTAPLHIATVAALTPPEVTVDLWDEPVQGLIDDGTTFTDVYDIVGITGYALQFERARQISKLFRDRGIPVVVGGSGVSSAPELYRPHFDILFVGEAEATWPAFVADFLRGDHRAEYRTEALPDLAMSPAPRWDSIADQMKTGYLTACVQVTRGCPFNCEFCDVWQIFGRTMRTKPVPQVLSEIGALQRLGVDTVLIGSDSFHGNPRYAKELVRALIPFNNAFPEPLQYRTELTITVARDEELLELMADANFYGYLVGIESPSAASLTETRKNHNLRFGDLTENCLKVMSYGVPIEGSMIVGFDSDTPDIFDLQYQFLQEACIPLPRPHMLKAIRGTDLWRRLTLEGRVIEADGSDGSTRRVDPQHSSNIIPRGMTRAELFSGYLSLMERVFAWESFEERMVGFLTNIRRPPNVRRSPSRLPGMLKAALPGMGGEAAETLDRVLATAEREVPFMLSAVAILCIRQYQEVLGLPHLRENVLRQIDAERALEGVRPPVN